MTSAYETSTTNWDRTEDPAAAVEQDYVPDEAGKLADLMELARGASSVCEIEHAIESVFERRGVLARRLHDAVKRHDNNLAAESARDWLRSEIRLHELFTKYAGYVQERSAMVQSLSQDAIREFG